MGLWQGCKVQLMLQVGNSFTKPAPKIWDPFIAESLTYLGREEREENTREGGKKNQNWWRQRIRTLFYSSSTSLFLKLPFPTHNLYVNYQRTLLHHLSGQDASDLMCWLTSAIHQACSTVLEGGTHPGDSLGALSNFSNVTPMTWSPNEEVHICISLNVLWGVKPGTSPGLLP